MKNSQLVIGTFISLLMGSPITFAALPESLEFFQKDLDYAILQEMQQNSDQVNEFDAELFPDRKDDSVVEKMKKSANENTSHVTVEIRGKSVVLEDVPRYAWFAEFVEDMATRGIISGYQDVDGNPLGQYGPADNVTIEQLSKIAVEAAGIDLEYCTNSIKNENAQGSWSESYIRCAESYDWAIYSDGTVDVSRSATRSEVVTTILQAFEANFKSLDGTVFKDVNATTEFGVAIETAAADGIVSGFTDEEGNLTGFFGPSDFVNRAEIAKIVSMALKIYLR
ncbi:S-layer homology domain-containing protein [Patescibacteria group bacterium]|nr:S-layer homology domain-containing protein [Patescibacteria group bacterium]